MKIFPALYVVGVALLFVGLWLRARSMKRRLRSPATQRSVGPIAAFLAKERPKDWYVSLAFCAGFALAGGVVLLVLDAAR